MPKADVIQFYDDGHGANTSVTQPRFMTWLARRDRTLLFDLLAIAPGLTVLDAGCGAGHHARELAARGLHVTAIDRAPRMVERVRAFVASAEVADLDELALGRTFDRVLCAGVLEFVADPEASLGRLAQHLAPGGRLAVMVPRASLGGRVYRRLHRVDFRLFTARQLDRAAASCGLALIAHAHPFVHSLVIAWERPRLARAA